MTAQERRRHCGAFLNIETVMRFSCVTPETKKDQKEGKENVTERKLEEHRCKNYAFCQVFSTSRSEATWLSYITLILPEVASAKMKTGCKKVYS